MNFAGGIILEDDHLAGMPLQEAEFEVWSQSDIKPLILSSNTAAYDMEITEESNEDIEVEFHAVMEKIIKPEENCDDSEPGFFSIPRIDNESSLICRLCANRGNEMIDMLEGNQEYENIVEKIEECLPIVVRLELYNIRRYHRGK